MIIYFLFPALTFKASRRQMLILRYYATRHGCVWQTSTNASEKLTSAGLNPSECLYVHIKLHDIPPQKTVILAAVFCAALPRRPPRSTYLIQWAQTKKLTKHEVYMPSTRLQNVLLRHNGKFTNTNRLIFLHLCKLSIYLPYAFFPSFPRSSSLSLSFLSKGKLVSVLHLVTHHQDANGNSSICPRTLHLSTAWCD
jgi:hypothetical protein